MKLRTWLLSVVAICFLGMASWALGQTADVGGGGSASGNTTQQNANQQPNQNQQQNGDQNKEEAPPQGPTYLTFTKEANPGLKAGKSEETQSAVEIKSAPVGADVTVNGYNVGSTPTSVELPPGEYIVTVNKWGYREYINVLEVSGGKPYSLSPTLLEDW
jgi:cytoskeletal protein RodZ